MRLINTKTFLQCEFTDNIPKYAILSHTWGEEEVTYQDYAHQKESSQRLLGFKKIEYLAEQAKAVGIEWVWVDTACIDKTSSAELSEALNSMMQWYTDADMCYAYLEDIENDDGLEVSRWFTRGWTLQELIAPMQVHFFAREWTYIGSKSSLADRISKSTGIDTIVLRQEGAFRLFSVATRMSWASKRKTTRIEDEAYCLLGLFDINLPAIYGEGERAFSRLQQEIIRSSSDESVLAWNKNGVFSTSGLAARPSFFQSKRKVIPLNPTEKHRPPILTNRGLQMYVRAQDLLVTGGQPEIVAILNCRFERCFDGYVGVPLIQSRSSDTFYRKGTESRSIVPASTVQKLQWWTIYLNIASKVGPTLGIKRSPCLVRLAPALRQRGYRVLHDEPSNARGSWEPDFMTSEVTYSPRETDKTIVRSFLIVSDTDQAAFLASLVTGYLDADVKLYVVTKPWPQYHTSFDAEIQSAASGVFEGLTQVQSRFEALGIEHINKDGRPYSVCLELLTEELLETKVRVINVLTVPEQASRDDEIDDDRSHDDGDPTIQVDKFDNDTK